MGMNVGKRLGFAFLTFLLLVCPTVYIKIKSFQGYRFTLKGVTVSPNDSSSELGGIRLTIRKIEANGNERAHVFYAMENVEYTGGAYIVFDRPWYLVRLRFWDLNENEIGQPLSYLRPLKDRRFRENESLLFEDDFVFDIPKGAKYIAVQVPGPMTNKVLIE